MSIFSAIAATLTQRNRGLAILSALSGMACNSRSPQDEPDIVLHEEDDAGIPGDDAWLEDTARRYDLNIEEDAPLLEDLEGNDLASADALPEDASDLPAMEYMCQCSPEEIFILSENDPNLSQAIPAAFPQEADCRVILVDGEVEVRVEEIANNRFTWNYGCLEIIGTDEDSALLITRYKATPQKMEGLFISGDEIYVSNLEIADNTPDNILKRYDGITSDWPSREKTIYFQKNNMALSIEDVTFSGPVEIFIFGHDAQIINTQVYSTYEEDLDPLPVPFFIGNEAEVQIDGSEFEDRGRFSADYLLGGPLPHMRIRNTDFLFSHRSTTFPPDGIWIGPNADLGNEDDPANINFIWFGPIDYAGYYIDYYSMEERDLSMYGVKFNDATTLEQLNLLKNHQDTNVQTFRDSIDCSSNPQCRGQIYPVVDFTP